MSLNSPFTSQPQTSHNQRTNTKTTAVAFNTFPGNGLVFFTFTFCCYFLSCLDFSPAPIPPPETVARWERWQLSGVQDQPLGCPRRCIQQPATLWSNAQHSPFQAFMEYNISF